MLKQGISVPNLGEFFDPHVVGDLAKQAEDAGWDGFFTWDHILPWSAGPVADPWITLTAVALATQRITLGPMVTPLARRRPWVVARQAVTLDHLSGGRLILGVGLGFPPDREFGTFGEDPSDHVRAEKLDEALAILDGMWKGEAFEFKGKHFQISQDTFLPRPLQQPRIPVWVAGMWPGRGPFRRAARWDGVFPIDAGTGGAAFSPEDLAEMVTYLKELRPDLSGFEIVAPLAQGRRAAEYEAAGATWVISGPTLEGGLDELRPRIAAGPPE
jgi:alkanesulfonate monooxygenase SsuD/methylene tetrahydromethanopterin reductase-like flavin-dependent oxidoreductase (luciferase family)